MKKFLSVVLAAALTLPTTMGFAANGAKSEEILRSVKDRIGSTEKYNKFDSSQSESTDGIMYDFSWETSDRDNYASLNVTVDANGIIRNYYKYDSSENDGDGKLSINKMTSEEAMKKAEALVNRLNPSISGKLRLESNDASETLSDSNFYFRINHIENGIRVYGDDGSVRYNAERDELRNFNIDYSASPKCNAVEKPLSVEDAQKNYMDKLGLKLIYKKFYTGKNAEKKVVPVYVPSNKNNEYINAETGEVETIISRGYGFRDTMAGGKGEASADAMSKNSGLTEAEISVIEELNGLMPRDSIVKAVKDNKVINMANNISMRYYSVYKDDDRYYANLSFESGEKENSKYVSVCADAKTGEIIRFSKGGELAPNNSAKISDDRAKAISDEAAKYMAGEKFDEYKFENGENGFYTYVRYVNDIPAEDDCITVDINMSDGKVSSYSCEYSDIEFPSLDGIIGKDEAGKALFGAVDYEMVYMPQCTSEKSEKTDLYVPVFMLDNTKPQIINAADGKLLDYDGEEYKEYSLAKYNDIDGHYAEQAIYDLARYGICFDGDTFRPDEAITQRDFMSLVVSAFVNRGRTYKIMSSDSEQTADIYLMAKRAGIIKDDEVNPDAAVSREEAAVFIIRALGIEEYASLNGIFVKPFEDVTTNVGAISILCAMNVFRGDGSGKFNPTANMSRANSVMVIYNYLSR